MKRIVAYRYKLKPTKIQRETLTQWLDACRYAYNLCFDYKATLWSQYRKNLKKNDAQKELTSLAKDLPCLGIVNSQTLQAVTDRLWNAYDRFFKGISKFPKFAKKNKYKSFAFKQGVKVHHATCTVQLPKIGKIKYRNSRPFPAGGEVKSATVSKQADGWYISLVVETEIQPLPIAPNASVGVDVGIKTLATLSTGETVENPKHIYKAAFKLRVLQRSVSRKKKGGKNRKKATQKLAKQYLNVTNTRIDYLHKLTNRLIRENQAIITEKLSIQNMVKNHKLARSIYDASWGELNRQLTYKAIWHGRHHEQVAPQHTSQDCSDCGYRNKDLVLSTRVWACPECGCVHDRDVNAAKNIQQKAVGQTVSAWESYSDISRVAQESPVI
jgi:putative transposase